MGVLASALPYISMTRIWWFRPAFQPDQNPLTRWASTKTRIAAFSTYRSYSLLMVRLKSE